TTSPELPGMHDGSPVFGWPVLSPFCVDGSATTKGALQSPVGMPPPVPLEALELAVALLVDAPPLAPTPPAPLAVPPAPLPDAAVAPAPELALAGPNPPSPDVATLLLVAPPTAFDAGCGS